MKGVILGHQKPINQTFTKIYPKKQLTQMYHKANLNKNTAIICSRASTQGIFLGPLLKAYALIPQFQHKILRITKNVYLVSNHQPRHWSNSNSHFKKERKKKRNFGETPFKLIKTPEDYSVSHHWQLNLISKSTFCIIYEAMSLVVPV